MDVFGHDQSVNKIIQAYCAGLHPSAHGSEYKKILEANTDHLQGNLVLVGYELCGGEDSKMIGQAALAIELFHAYLQCVNKGIDLTQALRAQHEAEIILANLEADPENRIKALGITNRTLMLANLARLESTSEEDKIYWLATEQVLNPLHVGQVLAGADCKATNAVTPLALEFGGRFVSGKKVDTTKFIEELQKITW